MIFKKNQSKRFHIISIIIGVLLVTVGTIIYALLYLSRIVITFCYKIKTTISCSYSCLIIVFDPCR